MRAEGPNAFAVTPEAKAALKAHAALPPEIMPLAWAYLALFRPRGRALQWRRAKKLLEDLHAEIKSGGVQWDGRPNRDCPPKIWAASMEIMLGARFQKLPLTNHNYLKSVALDLADRASREAETARNKLERSGTWRPPNEQGFTPVTPEEMKQIRMDRMKK